MTYEEYRNAVLIAVVEAEIYRRPALNLAGQIDVWRAVREADLSMEAPVLHFDLQSLHQSCPPRPAACADQIDIRAWSTG